MIKVVVADDEPLILRSVKKLIEEAHPSFKVVGEAADGEDALRRIEEIHPDVLFTDIRMPVMDGLELIDELRKREIAVIPVLVSGCEDFQYARKAIGLGVSEYLTKPLSVAPLQQLLGSLYGKIRTSKRAAQSSALQTALLHARMSPGQRDLFADYETFSFLSIRSASSRIWRNLDNLPGLRLEEGEDFWVVDGDRDIEKAVIFGASSLSAERLDTLAKRIHELLASHGVPVTSLIGSMTGDIEELGPLLRESWLTIHKRMVFGKSRILVLNSEDGELPSELEPILTVNLEKKLTLLVQNDRQQLCKEELKRLLESFEARPYPLLFLEKTLKQWVKIAADAIPSVSPMELLDTDLEIHGMLNRSTDYAALFDGMSRILDHLFAYNRVKISIDGKQKMLADRIEQYIEANYSKPLSLFTLSEVFGLVPSYLSKLYKTYKGISPSERITNIRIEKSKSLLEIDPPLLLKEISAAVGYEDPYYFSRIFKSATGHSPSGYRSLKA